MPRTHAPVPSRWRRIAGLSIVFLALAATASIAQGTKAMTFEDLMKFRAIQKPVIADDGSIVAYGAQPDRGDGEGVVHALASNRLFRVPRGSAPVVSGDARWVAMVVKPPFAETARAGKTPPKPGMALLDTRSGAVVSVDRVERFAFSDDSKWLAYLLSAPAEDRKPAEGAAPEKKTPVGTPLELRNLASGDAIEIADVLSFAFDDAAKYLAYVVAAPEGTGNGLFARDLAAAGRPVVAIRQADGARYAELTWAPEASVLAFVTARTRRGRWSAGTARRARPETSPPRPRRATAGSCR
jgi:hypothetical protein